jgi:hypothetical protein
MELSALKSEICAAARDGQAIQKKLQATRALERDSLWNQKRALGRRTRYLLLAYGYVRSVPYRLIEPRCRPGNEPNWYRLADVLMELEQPVDAEPEPTGALASLAERLRRFVHPVTSAAPISTDKYRRRMPYASPLETWLNGVAATGIKAIGARS